MSDTQTTSTYRVESLARGLSVLSSFSIERPALSLTDVSQHLDLNKTTALRILSTLESLGYVKRDPQTKLYQPALAVFKLGFVVLDTLEVRQVARPYLKRLADEVKETVNLVILDNYEAVYIDRVGSKYTVNASRPIGSRSPVHCTSTGKALVAFLPPDQLEQTVAGIDWIRYTENTILTPGALRQDLEMARQNGYSVSRGELIPDLWAVAAPIYGNDGQVTAAVNISIPAHRASDKKIKSQFGPRVVKAGNEISRALGYLKR